MPTPIPTHAQTLEHLQSCGGRPSASWNELLRIIHDGLPGALAEANARFSLKPPLPALQGVIVAGENAPFEFPWAEIALSTDTSPFGGDFSDSSNVVIHFKMQQGVVTRAKLRQLSDIACIARALLWHYIGPHPDAAGRVLWSQLAPTSLSVGPAQAAAIGTALHLRLDNYPGEGAWTPGTAEPQSDPTPEEVIDALPLCGGRLSLARESVLDLLEKYLPEQLSYVSEQTGVKLLRPTTDSPFEYLLLGQEISGTHPAIVVGATATTEAVAPRVFADRLQLTLYCIRGAGETRAALNERADFAGVVRAFLMNYYDGYEDASGRSAWGEMAPSSLSMGQMPWEWTSGTVLRYEAYQGPNEVRW